MARNYLNRRYTLPKEIDTDTMKRLLREATVRLLIFNARRKEANAAKLPKTRAAPRPAFISKPPAAPPVKVNSINLAYFQNGMENLEVVYNLGIYRPTIGDSLSVLKYIEDRATVDIVFDMLTERAQNVQQIVAGSAVFRLLTDGILSIADKEQVALVVKSAVVTAERIMFETPKSEFEPMLIMSIKGAHSELNEKARKLVNSLDGRR